VRKILPDSRQRFCGSFTSEETDMRAKIAVAVGMVLAVAAGAYAQSGWMQNSPIRTMMAPADVTCYSIEPWFSLASVTTRMTQLCFLRVQTEVGEWTEIPAK
jgi:hypothetical protein